jgi:hypothetical protein
MAATAADLTKMQQELAKMEEMSRNMEKQLQKLRNDNNKKKHHRKSNKSVVDKNNKKDKPSAASKKPAAPVQKKVHKKVQKTDLAYDRTVLFLKQVYKKFPNETVARKDLKAKLHWLLIRLASVALKNLHFALDKRSSQKSVDKVLSDFCTANNEKVLNKWRKVVNTIVKKHPEYAKEDKDVDPALVKFVVDDVRKFCIEQEEDFPSDEEDIDNDDYSNFGDSEDEEEDSDSDSEEEEDDDSDSEGSDSDSDGSDSEGSDSEEESGDEDEDSDMEVDDEDED